MPVRSTVIAFCALLAALPLGEAQAQKRNPREQETLTIGRISPRQMAAVLRERGNPAEITTDNNRTRLTTEISGLRTSVHFYSCNDGGCQSIQYRTLFRRNERFTLAFVNAWNYEKRFAKAYLDRDGDLVLEWDVDLDGGVSVAYVAETVSTFQAMLNTFGRFTPADGGASPDAGNTGRSLTPGQSGGAGRSTAPGRAPAEAAPPATGGKGSSGDAPGERRT
ncbi:YbjN domain-containing protein [Phreatobacter oligotrophus]|uniref:Putative sensory transduction regulator n=1 Tax=Phreatobacter oligotrophus TaxID=1122261 RepID=A0A2T4Z562_9HYPH|nr:YbjN domain-containing protein [Phreatobacter oligotrophus]PTM57031.1 putative sensory transduction regulator [Phreatobacter oligotrophus]